MQMYHDLQNRRDASVFGAIAKSEAPIAEQQAATKLKQLSDILWITSVSVTRLLLCKLMLTIDFDWHEMLVVPRLLLCKRMLTIDFDWL